MIKQIRKDLILDTDCVSLARIRYDGLMERYNVIICYKDIKKHGDVEIKVEDKEEAEKLINDIFLAIKDSQTVKFL